MSAKREYRDENVFLKVDRALSKLITSFKSRSSDIVLLKVGNLHQNAKRYEARNTVRDENVGAKRADFFDKNYLHFISSKRFLNHKTSKVIKLFLKH